MNLWKAFVNYIKNIQEQSTPKKVEYVPPRRKRRHPDDVFTNVSTVYANNKTGASFKSSANGGALRISLEDKT